MENTLIFLMRIIHLFLQLYLYYVSWISLFNLVKPSIVSRKAAEY